MARDEVEQLLVESAGQFLAARHDSARIRLSASAPLPFDADLWAGMAELGWLALRLPESLGGAGLGLTHAAALAEQLGLRLVPEPYIACGLIPAVLCAAAAHRTVRTELADRLLTGRGRTTLAWQERSGQVDPMEITTCRNADGSLDGIKQFVPNVDSADSLIVSVQAAGQPMLIVISTCAEGVAIDTQTCADRSTRGRMKFEHAAAGAILAEGRSAADGLQRAIEEARLAAAAYQTGLALGVVERILAYLQTRVQFDRPLGTLQTLQHRAADLYMLIQLAGASWRHAARVWDAQPASMQACAAISAAKARAAQAALQTARAAIQIHGGLGFAEETELGVAMRMALQYSSWLGGRAQHLRRFAGLTGLAS